MKSETKMMWEYKGGVECEGNRKKMEEKGKEH